MPSIIIIALYTGTLSIRPYMSDGGFDGHGGGISC